MFLILCHSVLVKVHPPNEIVSIKKYSGLFPADFNHDHWVVVTNQELVENPKAQIHENAVGASATIVVFTLYMFTFI